MINTNQILKTLPNGIHVAIKSEDLPADSMAQQEHYDKIYHKYVENFSYPHTMTYTNYMDQETLKELPTHLGSIAEICCGHGEALLLLKKSL